MAIDWMSVDGRIKFFKRANGRWRVHPSWRTVPNALDERATNEANLREPYGLPTIQEAHAALVVVYQSLIHKEESEKSQIMLPPPGIPTRQVAGWQPAGFSYTIRRTDASWMVTKDSAFPCPEAVSFEHYFRHLRFDTRAGALQALVEWYDHHHS